MHVRGFVVEVRLLWDKMRFLEDLLLTEPS
jgi:hypothetical protein